MVFLALPSPADDREENDEEWMGKQKKIENYFNKLSNCFNMADREDSDSDDDDFQKIPVDEPVPVRGSGARVSQSAGIKGARG